VNIEFHRLVRRLHIIYFRETEHPTDILLPALLSTFKKRNFTPVTHKRTSKVWASRKELLQYERALELDKLLDEIEEESVSKRATKTPAPRIKRESFTTPVTPGSSRDFSTPLKTPIKQSAKPKSDWNGETDIFESINLDEDVIQTTREQKIKKHFDDWVYPGWQELVAVEDEGVRPRPIGLERFDAGESSGKISTLYFINYRACVHQDGP
jgi:Fanconi-associated nuclease 1